MNKILKLISLDAILKFILSEKGLEVLMTLLVGRVGMTDVMGYLVSIGVDLFNKGGRLAIIRALMIKFSSLDSWAKKVHGANGAAVENVHVKFAALAVAFADAVESLAHKK